MILLLKCLSITWKNQKYLYLSEIGRHLGPTELLAKQKVLLIREDIKHYIIKYFQISTLENFCCESTQTDTVLESKDDAIFVHIVY